MLSFSLKLNCWTISPCWCYLFLKWPNLYRSTRSLSIICIFKLNIILLEKWNLHLSFLIEMLLIFISYPHTKTWSTSYYISMFVFLTSSGHVTQFGLSLKSQANWAGKFGKFLSTQALGSEINIQHLFNKQVMACSYNPSASGQRETRRSLMFSCKEFILTSRILPPNERRCTKRSGHLLKKDT